MSPQEWTDSERAIRRSQTRYACVLVSIANDLLEGICTINGAQYRLKKFLGISLTTKEVKKIHEEIEHGQAIP